jgi:hypothetical protein
VGLPIFPDARAPFFLVALETSQSMDPIMAGE